MLCFTNVNVNAPLTHFYGFCNVTVAEKAFPFIYSFDISRTCTNDPNSTALNDVKWLFFVIVYLCIPGDGFDAIFDWYFSMLGSFSYLHIVKSMLRNRIKKKIGFLDIHSDVHVTFYVYKFFQCVALIPSLKRRFRISLQAIYSQ